MELCQSARALIVAAPRSGAGKTTVTLALLAAFRRRGVRVRAAKSGPDYIDPAFHEAASGAPVLNLDSWAMAPDLLEAMLTEAACGAELLLIEGAMGLFDGSGERAGESGAVADLAARFALSVLLVLDVAGQAQTAAAVARGLADFRPAVKIAGVVLNRMGSPRHHAMILPAMARAEMAVFGALPRESALALPERHLGLVQAGEQAGLGDYLARLAVRAETAFDLDAILAAATPLPPLSHGGRALNPPGQRIALARDEAFSFIYPHLLACWREAGAEILFFSPLEDEPPPAGCDICWLPGGYPELHAGRLAGAARFRAGMAEFAAHHKVHGECGGYMVLGAFLEDAEGVGHPMLGLLSHASSFARRRLSLGYRRARLLGESVLGAAGVSLRGHEFHYATLAVSGDDAPLAELQDAAGRVLGPSGGQRGLVSGSFFHVIAAETKENVS